MNLCRYCQRENPDGCVLRFIRLPNYCRVNADTKVSPVLLRGLCGTCHEQRPDPSMPCDFCGDID